MSEGKFLMNIVKVIITMVFILLIFVSICDIVLNKAGPTAAKEIIVEEE